MNSQLVTWSNLTVPGNGTKTVTLQAQVRSAAQNGTNIVNNAFVDSATAQDITTVQTTGTDITIDLTDSRDPVEERDTFSYTIRLTNLRSTSVTGFTVTQILDSDTEFRSASQGGFSNGNTVTWTNQTIPANGTLTLTTDVRVRSDVDDGDILNSRAFALNREDFESTRVRGEDDDDDDDDNDDLTIDVRDSEDPVEQGDTFSYIIRVRNSRNRTVRTDVRGFLDNNTTFVSASDSGRRRDDDEVEWDNVTIPSNSSRTFTVHVRVDTDADDGDTLRFRARAGNEEDTELTRVSGEAVTGGDARITVDKQANRTEVQPNDTVTYTITVENQRNTSIRDVVIEDTYPATSDFSVSNISSGGQNNGRTIRWELDTLSGNETRTFTYTARINGRHGQVFHNNVTVRAGASARPATATKSASSRSCRRQA